MILIFGCTAIYVNVNANIIKGINVGSKLDYEDPKNIFNTYGDNKVKKPYKMILLLDVNDCPKCLNESILWERIQKEYEEYIDVLAIFKMRDVKKIDKIVRGKNINIAYCIDEKKQVFGNYKFNSPFKILLDSNNVILYKENITGRLTKDDYIYNLLNQYKAHSQTKKESIK